MLIVNSFNQRALGCFLFIFFNMLMIIPVQSWSLTRFCVRTTALNSQQNQAAADKHGISQTATWRLNTQTACVSHSSNT